MKDNPLVAVIVPVHNDKEDTVEFLDSLKEVIYPNYKVIVIDNASTDGTEELIKQEYPYVLLLKSARQMWWSGSLNIGIEKAIELGADYVLLMNNDMVVDREYISASVAAAEKIPKAIIQSKVYLYDDPKRIAEVGGEMRWPKGWRAFGAGEIDKGQHDTQREVHSVSLNSTLINTAFFKDIGLLDYENFPFYFGGQDFNFRARNKGYHFIYEPKSLVWHKVGITAKKIAPVPTGFFLPAFIRLTTSLASPFNLRIFTRFCLRWCPWYLIPLALLRRLLLAIRASIGQTFYFRFIPKSLKSRNRD